MSTGRNQAEEEAAERSVVVLGMHRSGTSLVTRVINLLGVPLCRDDDFLTGPDNPTGHWESASLMALNDKLLQAFGGSYYAPQPMADGWEHTQNVTALQDDARQVFGRMHPAKTWVWKDPRTCLTLPFWRTIWPNDPLVVFVYREPLEVVSSLSRRDGFGKAHCIALWERYTRSAICGAKNLPFVTVHFSELMTDPVSAVTRLRSDLTSLGASAHGDANEAQKFVSAEQVASRLESMHFTDDPDASSAQRSLLKIIETLPRAAAHFGVPDLGSESSSTTELLAAIGQRDNYHPPRFRVAAREVWPAFRRAASNRIPHKLDRPSVSPGMRRT